MVLIGLLLAMLLAAARAKPRPMSCELEGPPPAESAMAETGFGAVFRIYATGLKNMPPHLLPHIGEIALNVEINPSCDLMYIPEAHMGFFRLADGAIYTHHPYQTQQLFIDQAGFLRFTSIPRDWEGNHTWVGWYRNGCSLSFEGKSFFACHLGHRWVIKTDSSNEICVPVSLVMQPWLPANKCSYY